MGVLKEGLTRWPINRYWYFIGSVRVAKKKMTIFRRFCGLTVPVIRKSPPPKKREKRLESDTSVAVLVKHASKELDTRATVEIVRQKVVRHLNGGVPRNTNTHTHTDDFEQIFLATGRTEKKIHDGLDTV